MNIKERKELLSQSLDLRRFTSDSGGDIVFPEFDWNSLIRPPLYTYIPPNVIQELDRISSEPRLMNKPTVRYKMTRELLAPYGFRSLAPGTNRQTFYSEKDPGVVLKIGSDRVGKSDNLSEYHLQNLIKPFCPKTFDVSPSGVVALSERVEPMTEHDFKHVWAEQVFDFIFFILCKGFIMEDVGGNFYKNWGVRFGFGPVILDYPYIYEIDWSKLKCCYVDPRTNIKCDGYVDYDYDKGLSEIVCEKCGSRYSASYLARLIPSSAFNPINRRRNYKMSRLFNPNVKVSVVKGNEVIYRHYNESDTRIRPVVKDTTMNGMMNEQIRTANDTRVNNNIPEQRRDRGYTQSVRDDIAKFLTEIEEKHSKGLAINLARKLGVRYEPKVKQEIQTNNKSNKFIDSLDGVIKKFDTFVKNEVQGTSEIQSTKIDEDTKEVKVEEEQIQDIDKPKEGLYPVKPKTAEEIEMEEMAKRGEESIIGIPGEPLVDTIKFKETVPKIKNLVIARFNDFEEAANKENQISELNTNITNFIKDDICNLTKSNGEGLELTIERTVDHVNKDCYKVIVFNYKSPIFECMLYPKRKESEEVDKSKVVPGINILGETDVKRNMENAVKNIDNEELNQDSANKLEEFFDKVIDNFSFDTFEKKDNALRNAIISYLYSEAMDNYEGIEDIPCAKIFKTASKYVDENYSFDEEKINTVQDEL